MRRFSKMSRKFPKKYNKWHVIETNEVSLEDQNCWFNLGELLVHRSRRIRINVIQVVLILLLQDYAIDTKCFKIEIKLVQVTNTLMIKSIWRCKQELENQKQTSLVQFQQHQKQRAFNGRNENKTAKSITKFIGQKVYQWMSDVSNG